MVAEVTMVMPEPGVLQSGGAVAPDRYAIWKPVVVPPPEAQLTVIPIVETTVAAMPVTSGGVTGFTVTVDVETFPSESLTFTVSVTPLVAPAVWSPIR